MATTLRTSGITMGSSTLDVSGSAPSFACRCFINYNGTTNGIRGSGNVSSLTAVGGGQHTINFSTALPSANYSVCGTAGASVGTLIMSPTNASFVTNTSVRVFVSNTASGGNNESSHIACFQ